MESPIAPEEPVVASESQATRQQEARRLTLRRHGQFAAEAFLFLLLSAAVWWAAGAGGLDRIYQISPDYRLPFIMRSWERFAALGSIGFLFLAIIYYATSFEVTPFRLLLPFLGKAGIASLALTGRTIVRRVSSEEVLNKTADVEVDEIPAPKDEEEDQVIARILRESAHSAAKLAIKMERRINTHLILGVLVGVAGLAVWWISFHLGPGGPEVGPDKKADFTLYLEQAIPRITILLFIELLAGFFLRQYRIGVEDLKYFLELRRRADAKRIAYAIYALVDENQAKIDFANAIMKEQSDTRLASGESTTSLKAMEEEKNEMMQAFTTLADKFENVAKAFKGGK